MRAHFSLRLAATLGAALVILAAAAPAAQAQGKGNAKHGQGKPAKQGHLPPGQAKKRVTTSHAVIVTRDVLVSQGFRVVRVERLGDAQVIYYRRGNNGRGRGLGPVERLVVRPAGEIVAFEAAPRPVLLAVNVRLGL